LSLCKLVVNYLTFTIFERAQVLAKDSQSIDAVTDIILSVFRLNAQLLEQGDRLVQPLRLTGARWQVLGAIAIAGKPQTAPQIAAAMGVTRQGVQKQLNLAVADGLIKSHPNPRHQRSPLHALSARGQTAYDDAMALQRVWAKSLCRGLTLPELQSAKQVLAALERQLASVSVS
jgi:DNA-binding MarR family transcriptional regulator